MSTRGACRKEPKRVKRLGGDEGKGMCRSTSSAGVQDTSWEKDIWQWRGVELSGLPCLPAYEYDNVNITGYLTVPCR